MNRGHVDDPRHVSRRRQESLEIGVTQDYRRSIEQRVRLNGVGRPQRAIDD